MGTWNLSSNESIAIYANLLLQLQMNLILKYKV